MQWSRNMITPIVDAGPLIALFDLRDTHHQRSAELTAAVPGPMLTTCPALTEVMYFLGKKYGLQGQRAVWTYRSRGRLEIAGFDWDRAAELMTEYAKVGMDLADASLVALAEERDLCDVLTWDADFYEYRIRQGHGYRSFNVRR
jgi:predicted nucleic acid-binding protein